MEFASIMLVLGGLGLFLFGMKMMSNGLQALAGNKLQAVLYKATSNRFFAVIAGIVATIALNSSTASTVMTVSFINSGLMNLTQSIGVIMGANVGTTFSAHLVAFRVDSYAPIFIFVGVILYVFIKNKKLKDIGHVLLGFGILFFGITTMGGPLRALGQTDGFQAMLLAFESPWLALLAGFAFTAAVQSSTAATSILVAMIVSGVAIPFQTVAFIILGTNIGTSITTVIASIPANRESKRAALFHISYDIIGSTVFGLLIFFVPAILGIFETVWTDPAQQAAWFHTLYNIATLLLLLPFVKLLAKLMQRIIPVQEKKSKMYLKEPNFLGKELSRVSPIHTSNVTYQAVRNARLEVGRMYKLANENIENALKAFFDKDVKLAQEVLELEEIVDYLNDEITTHLVHLNNTKLSLEDAEKIGGMMQICTDIERISDHAENIAEYTIHVTENNIKFSEEALNDLKELADATNQILTDSLKGYTQKDAKVVPGVKKLEDKVDELSKQFAQNHIDRLKSNACDPKSSVIFVDLISDLERTSDHANNVASSLLALKNNKTPAPL